MAEGRPPVNLRMFGSTGLRRQGSAVYEEFLPELRWPRAGRVYQEMSDNDPVIGSILYLAEMLIRSTDWSVKAASDSTQDTEAAKFVESCMNDMEVSWADTISEILSMLSYGFSLHEIVYKIRRGPDERSGRYHSRYSDGKIGWRCLPIRGQTSITDWHWDKQGNLVAATQQAEPDYRIVQLPMTKCLLFRTRVSKDNPEGKSLLRNAYRPWFFKKHFEEIEGIGIERDLAGFPVLKAPADLDLWNDSDERMTLLRARAEELVASIRRDSEEGVLLPAGWELTLLTSTSSRQIDIGTTIERYDNRIALTMLSDIVLLGTKSGSFALADTKQSTLAQALQSQLNSIADVFNTHAVTKLMAINGYKLEQNPRIVPGQIQSPSNKELALMLRAMGVSVTRDMKLQNYLRHALNLPELTKQEFDEIYAIPNAIEDANNIAQTAEEAARARVDDDRVRDDVTREFEQNELRFTDMEVEA